MTRRRYRYDLESKQLVEIGEDWTDAPRHAPVATEEVIFGHCTGPAGEDLSTRKRHREYQRQNGLTMASDFAGEWARAAETRERARRGDFPDTAHRREAVARAAYKLESKRR